MDSKKCCKCKRELTLDNFYGNVCTQDGYQAECKNCQRARTEAYRNRNRERNLRKRGSSNDVN